MNDHIPDPTKMISDTPRTDAVYFKKGATMYDLANEMKLVEHELNAANQRIKRLEEQLMDAKNKHAVLVADVVLNEDRAERIKRLEETLDKTTKIASQRIKRLEDRIHRAAMAFFRDGSDGQVASDMLVILEEERGKP